jgi:hypothetical protein
MQCGKKREQLMHHHLIPLRSPFKLRIWISGRFVLSYAAFSSLSPCCRNSIDWISDMESNSGVHSLL